jgi:catechol 2,3-dioxygenase-like lactoylglutathione lyase family enzyme
MIRGIKFVSIPVGNQDVSLKFYTESLGLKVVTDQPFTDTQRWIELLIPGADTGLALFTPEGHEKRIGEFQGVAFWCDDLFATAKRLKSKGVTFAQEPKNEPWGSLAVFKDPDGNQFALSICAGLCHKTLTDRQSRPETGKTRCSQRTGVGRLPQKEWQPQK